MNGILPAPWLPTPQNAFSCGSTLIVARALARAQGQRGAAEYEPRAEDEALRQELATRSAAADDRDAESDRRNVECSYVLS